MKRKENEGKDLLLGILIQILTSSRFCIIRNSANSVLYCSDCSFGYSDSVVTMSMSQLKFRNSQPRKQRDVDRLIR